MNCLEIDHRGACVLLDEPSIRVPVSATGVFSPFHPLDLERWLPHADRIEIYRLNLPWAEKNTSPYATFRSNSDTQHDLLERAKSAERAVARLRAKLAGLTGCFYDMPGATEANGPGEIPKSDYGSLQAYSWAQYQTISAMGERAKELEAECLGLRNAIADYGKSLEFSRADHQRTIQRSIVLERERDEAKQESIAAQSLWHAVSNECGGLRADVKAAEAQFELTDKLLALRTKERDEARSTREYLTTELNKARKELEELRTRVRNSLRSPIGDYKQ